MYLNESDIKTRYVYSLIDESISGFQSFCGFLFLLLFVLPRRDHHHQLMPALPARAAAARGGGLLRHGVRDGASFEYLRVQHYHGVRVVTSERCPFADAARTGHTGDATYAGLGT